MRRDDIPPSQGGKYAGFGSSCNSGPPARSNSTQDFVGNTFGGLTNSLSSISLTAGSLGGRVAEVGWKFTSLAGQKAAELSEGVTEKVKEGNLLQDLASGVTNVTGKVTEAVGKGKFDISSLWGSTRSEYQPCEDSGLLETQSGGMGGYHDNFRSNSGSVNNGSNGRDQDNFSGFGDSDGFQKDSRKDSDDWGNSWGDDSGWSESTTTKSKDRKPKFSANAGSKDKKIAVKENKSEGEDLLIDLNDGKDNKWDNDWEDDAWESLNKDD